MVGKLRAQNFPRIFGPKGDQPIDGVPERDVRQLHLRERIAGQWIRAEPAGTIYQDAPMQTDEDTSPDPGVACYVTANGTDPNDPGEADVDDGCTTLLTPVFDLSTASRAFVTYQRWWAQDGFTEDDDKLAEKVMGQLLLLDAENHDPIRVRKLLLRRREIERLARVLRRSDYEIRPWLEALLLVREGERAVERRASSGWDRWLAP